VLTVAVCAVTDEFEKYQSGIFKDTTGASGINHEISIVGWGVGASALPSVELQLRLCL